MLKMVVDDADRGNQPEVLDVRASRFRHPQPVERGHGDQRMLGGQAEARCDQERAEFVAV